MIQHVIPMRKENLLKSCGQGLDKFFLVASSTPTIDVTARRPIECLEAYGILKFRRPIISTVRANVLREGGDVTSTHLEELKSPSMFAALCLRR
jgi:hypothetical protein